MRILARPAFKSRNENPYNWLLYNSIRNLKIYVDESSLKRVLWSSYTIWHLHWPELYLNNKNKVEALVKILALLFQMDWFRWRGGKTVWTVHNLSAHEQLYPKLETWFWRAFIQRLDGYISLSKAGMEAAQERFPKLKNLPGFVIPHGHYRGEYPDFISSDEARIFLEISPTAKVVLFFGRIRPYKNVLALIQAFREFLDPEALLYIVGCPDFPTLAEAIKTEAALDNRVRMHLDFIPQEKAQVYFRAADLVILPYREILNSGTALLALSFDCPLLVPLQGTLSELQTQIGEEWVRTFTGGIVPSEIEQALEWALNKPRSQQAPLEVLDWQELAKQTIDAYKTIVTIA